MKRRIISICFLLATSLFGATSVSQYGITLYFDQDYTVGQYANGDYYIVAPSGLTIIGIDPPSLIEPDGRVRHGAMLNPVPRNFMQVGFDSTTTASWRYNAALNVARPGNLDLSAENPLVIVPASANGYAATLMCSISRPIPYDRPQFTEIAIFTVVASAPPAGSFRPPYGKVDKTHYWNKSQLNFAALPSLAKVAGSPSTVSTTALAKPFIDLDPGSGSPGRDLHPSNNRPIYGEQIAEVIAGACIELCLDFTPAQKEDLAIRVVQHGLDIYGVVSSGPIGQVDFEANGGHNMGRKLPMLIAALMLNDADIAWYCDRQNYFGFQEDRQKFIVSEADVGRYVVPLLNNKVREQYGPEHVGLPEWGQKHVESPEFDGSNWGVDYRNINFRPMLKHAWVAQMVPGARALWNNQIFFDYHDRAWMMETANPVGSWGTHMVNLWNTYRSIGGPIWTATPPANYAPIISVQPQSATRDEGQSVTFLVGADALPAPAYQWRKGGVNVGGATASTYTIAGLTLADAGTYDVVVANSVGSVTSAGAVLTVSPVAPPPPPPPTAPGRQRNHGQRLLVSP